MMRKTKKTIADTKSRTGSNCRRRRATYALIDGARSARLVAV
jgi:hypothetical protein